jgi:Domain of unknown function (DUF4386)
VRTSPTRQARLAGLLYLLVTAAAFNEGYVLPRTVVAGDAVATAEHIRASSTLFRLGFLGDLVAGTCWLLTAMALYVLLGRVDHLAAAAMVIFAAVGAAIQCLNQLNQYTALTVATGGGPDSVALMFATLQHNGYAIDEVFFGLGWFPWATWSSGPATFRGCWAGCSLSPAPATSSTWLLRSSRRAAARWSPRSSRTRPAPSAN